MITKEILNSKHSGEQMVAMENKKLGPAWLHWYRCPIVPNIRFRTGNSQNTWTFSFHWLVFNMWTMNNPEVGFQVGLDDRQLVIRVRFPYLITGLFIPIFPERFAHKLWRKPKREPRLINKLSHLTCNNCGYVQVPVVLVFCLKCKSKSMSYVYKVVKE